MYFRGMWLVAQPVPMIKEKNVVEEIQPKLTVVDVLRYLVAYACWIISALLSMLTLLITRNALNVVWPLLGGNRWLLRAVDRFGLVFLGLVWLVYVIFVEQHYRLSITAVRTRRGNPQTGTPPTPTSIPRNPVMRFLRKLGLDILARRFVSTMIPPLALLAVAYVTEQVVLRFVVG
jgi:hypothetical protein